MQKNGNPFKIGLCMAGAVSAGAYTAGVIDYLMEALDEWQRRKDNHIPNTPSHQVEIPIIGGASAGGITGIILSSMLQHKIEPIRRLHKGRDKSRPYNALYHTWVNLTQDDMVSALLSLEDIHKDKKVESLLNANFIDKIAEQLLNLPEHPVVRRKYIANRLKVFVTLSNLEGMSYPLTFQSNVLQGNRYEIVSHNDYACFKLSQSEEDYSGDGWIPLNFQTGLNTKLAKDAAMATGAFPIGLKARKISRNKAYMNDLDWFYHITKDADNPFLIDPYTTVNVDGGLIDNEPFDRVIELLNQEMYQPHLAADPIHQDHHRFNRTVLLIDPFPSEPGIFDKDTALTTIVGNTFNAMLDQSRLKPNNLIDAMNPEKMGQFMIAPVRYEDTGDLKKKIEGKKAIAGGALFGFSGFMSKEFRIHDFFLGRANCERFLRHHFTVPAETTNKIFRNGYAGIDDKSPFTSKDGGLQIIPLFSAEQAQPYIPVFSNGTHWPSMKTKEIKSYRKKIKVRTEKILFHLSDYNKWDRLLLWIGAKVLLNRKIANSAIRSMLTSLKEHRLIQ